MHLSLWSHGVWHVLLFVVVWPCVYFQYWDVVSGRAFIGATYSLSTQCNDVSLAPLAIVNSSDAKESWKQATCLIQSHRAS